MDIRPVYNEAESWENNLHKPLPSSAREMRMIAFTRRPLEVQIPLKCSSTQILFRVMHHNDAHHNDASRLLSFSKLITISNFFVTFQRVVVQSRDIDWKILYRASRIARLIKDYSNLILLGKKNLYFSHNILERL